MFIVYIIGAVLLSILLGPHQAKPAEPVFLPSGFERQLMPTRPEDFPPMEPVQAPKTKERTV